jgi:hypothetical protein
MTYVKKHIIHDDPNRHIYFCIYLSTYLPIYIYILTHTQMFISSFMDGEIITILQKQKIENHKVGNSRKLFI